LALNSNRENIIMPANYDNVNAVWPDACRAPTPQEALTGARKLVRLALTLGPPNAPKRKFTGRFRLTSGNRHTWTHRGVFLVNPDRRDAFGGWKSITHGIAHWAGRRLFPGADPHDARVAFIERKLAEHVIANGWHEGKLKREPKAKAPVDRQEARHQRTIELIASWERKEKLAKTKLRKLKLRKKYYEKTLRKRAAIKAARVKARKLDLGEAAQVAAPQITTRSLDLD
jgi:hypothetical protein